MNQENYKNYVYIVRNPSRLQTSTYAKQITYNQEVMTAITKDDVQYLHKLIHKELDDQGCWSVQEENALDLIDLLYCYFFEEEEE